MKVYIAGFDVFLVNHEEHFKNIKDICKKYNVEPLIPTDKSIPNDLKDKKEISNYIFKSNIEMINSCDGILANLNAFRGSEPDSGTVFEVGYGYGIGKKIVGYTSSTDLYRTVTAKGYQSNDILYISNGKFGRCNIEDFGLPLNLMLSCSIDVMCGNEGNFEDSLKKLVDGYKGRCCNSLL